MDSITQAILGAAVGEAVLGKKIGRKAALLGAIGGSIPDLDVVLLPFFDDLQRISIHRGYSHSILFCVLGAFLFAWILSRFKFADGIQMARLWWFCFLVLFTHILLDAFTTYGTQLFLPLTDYRVSFDSISIIDPVYSLPLLIGLLWHLYRKNRVSFKLNFNYLGLLISSLYLLFTLFNKRHVENQFIKLADEWEIRFENILTVPVSVGNQKWYGVVKSKKGLYLGTYSLGQVDAIQVDFFPVNNHLLEGLDTRLVDRMKWFSQGFYTVAEHEGKIRFYNLQCDMQGIRYFGTYKAPTAFYFEIVPAEAGSYELSSGLHPKNTFK